MIFKSHIEKFKCDELHHHRRAADYCRGEIYIHGAGVKYSRDEADIALRMRNAEVEMAARGEFEYIIVNDTVDRAAAEMVELLAARRAARTAADADNR